MEMNTSKDESMVYTIERDDVLHAVGSCCSSCMFAQCIKRYNPNKMVGCGYGKEDTTYVHLNGEKYVLDETLSKLMKNFDRHNLEDFDSRLTFEKYVDDPELIEQKLKEFVGVSFELKDGKGTLCNALT